LVRLDAKLEVERERERKREKKLIDTKPKVNNPYASPRDGKATETIQRLIWKPLFGHLKPPHLLPEGHKSSLHVHIYSACVKLFFKIILYSSNTKLPPY